jgi:Cytochrome bd-type quinol oxidase, subunit 2
MSDFLKTLIPWANWWNALILSLDIIVVIVFRYYYNKTKSRNLLTSMPGLFTSLGILGTFGAICQSLAGISTDTAVTLPQVGMTVAEATASSHNSLDLKEIIANLIPAFSTSIYGLVFAFFATIFTKLRFAKEDAALVETLKYKEPERALEALDEHVTKMTEAIDNEVAANKENNQKLTDSIAAQSDILDKFVEKFVKEMENCFKAMNTVIEERVTNFGTTQFSQSRELLEGLTKRLGDDALGILASHQESVRTLTEASSADLADIRNSLKTAVDGLKADTVSGIETLTAQQMAALQKLADDSLALQKQSVEDQNAFNSNLLSQMSTSLSETATRIISSVSEQISLLEAAVAENVQKLNESYEFISDQSASIVSNYEQASEAYRDAVQNAHDLNEKIEKELVEVESGLKSVGKTNESVEKVISAVKEKEANMEAIVMRIEELGKAIVSLQKLESVLSRIAPK